MSSSECISLPDGYQIDPTDFPKFVEFVKQAAVHQPSTTGKKVVSAIAMYRNKRVKDAYLQQVTESDTEGYRMGTTAMSAARNYVSSGSIGAVCSRLENVVGAAKGFNNWHMVVLWRKGLTLFIMDPRVSKSTPAVAIQRLPGMAVVREMLKVEPLKRVKRVLVGGHGADDGMCMGRSACWLHQIVELSNGPVYPNPDVTDDWITVPSQMEPQAQETSQQAEQTSAPLPGNQSEDLSLNLPEQPARRGRGRPRKQTALLTEREVRAHELARSLRATGKLSAQQPMFEVSRKHEVEGLLKAGVSEVVDKADLRGRLFNARFVDEVKYNDKGPYEKSRLVVQAFRDEGKKEVLTQSPTIHRMSQRLIICIAASLLQNPEYGLYTRDISQAYVQSNTLLARKFYIIPPPEFQLPKEKILRVVKPLYGIPEAGNHWFRTYHDHHVHRLHLQPSAYDPSLLFATGSAPALVGLQTDDTLFCGDNEFKKLEQLELTKAGFPTKPLSQIMPDHPISFNGTVINLHQSGIEMTQTKHCEKIKEVDLSGEFTDQYVKQRALGAYVASMTQPEAACELAMAAQHNQCPSIDDAKALNECLKWQYNNKTRGLKFIPLDLTNVRLYTFIDASFARNKDLSSQLGVIIVLANEKAGPDGAITLHGNIVHWTSTKCRRVTRSVLASELYAMSHGFDIASGLRRTISQMLNMNVPLVTVTDSRSLFECLVKLGSTSEKRLMIDVMCLREAYEKRDITEMLWVTGNTNPADNLTKPKRGGVLKDLVESNRILLKTKGWVERIQALGANPKRRPRQVPENVNTFSLVLSINSNTCLLPQQHKKTANSASMSFENFQLTLVNIEADESLQYQNALTTGGDLTFFGEPCDSEVDCVEEDMRWKTHSSNVDEDCNEDGGDDDDDDVVVCPNTPLRPSLSDEKDYRPLSGQPHVRSVVLPDGFFSSPLDEHASRCTESSCNCQASVAIGTTSSLRSDLPLMFFKLFFTDLVFSTLAVNTNLYAAEKHAGEGSRPWRPCSAAELKIWVGLLIYLSVFGSSRPDELWKHDSEYPDHCISRVMSKVRWEQIKRYFHCSPSAYNVPKSQFYQKLEPVASMLQQSFQRYVIPATNVSIDECMVRFTGRSAHTVMIRGKPVPVGYYVLALCEAGYMYGFTFSSAVSGFVGVDLPKVLHQREYP